MLVLAPQGRDAAVVCGVLAEAGFEPRTCSGMEDVCRGIGEGVGTVVVAEEALPAPERDRLSAALALEPSWSDVSLIVLLARGRRGPGVWEVIRGLDRGGSPKLLERPLHVATLVSAVEAALRGRERQLQVRDELEARAAAEAALRASEQRLALAERAAGVGVFDWEVSTGRVLWTPAMKKLLGAAPEAEPCWDDWAARVHPEDLSRLEPFFERWIRARRPTERTWAYRYRRPDGSDGWMSAGGALVRGPGGTVARVIGANVDVTELKRAEEKVRALNATLERRVAARTAVAERRARDLRRLAGELEIAEHRERERLAAFLHDELQQLLFAAKIRLPGASERDGTPWRGDLEVVERLLDESLRASRHLSQELSPRVLEVGTFDAALRWLGTWFGEHHALSVTVEARKGADPSRPVRLLLFKAVRELLFNVAKHAGVGEARVTLARRGRVLSVEVRDGGRGFDTKAVDLDNPRSFGLFNVRERLTAVGGRLEIESRPDGGGARLRLVVPLPRGARRPGSGADPFRRRPGRRGLPKRSPRPSSAGRRRPPRPR